MSLKILVEEETIGCKGCCFNTPSDICEEETQVIDEQRFNCCEESIIYIQEEVEGEVEDGNI